MLGPFARCGRPTMLVESLQCGRVRPDEARGSAMAAELASTTDMGEKEPGAELGKSILGAVDDAFGPRSPADRSPEQSTTPQFGATPSQRLDQLTRLIGRGIHPEEV